MPSLLFFVFGWIAAADHLGPNGRAERQIGKKMWP